MEEDRKSSIQSGHSDGTTHTGAFTVHFIFSFQSQRKCQFCSSLDCYVLPADKSKVCVSPKTSTGGRKILPEAFLSAMKDNLYKKVENRGPTEEGVPGNVRRLFT